MSNKTSSTRCYELRKSPQEVLRPPTAQDRRTRPDFVPGLAEDSLSRLRRNFAPATGRIALVFVLVNLAASLQLAAFPIEQAAHRAEWRVKYEEGTEEIDKGTRMTVTVNNQTIVGERWAKGKREMLAIPVGEVTQIAYSLEYRSVASQVFGDRGVWRGVDCCSDPEGYLYLHCLAAYGVLSLGDQRKYFVKIAWGEEDDENFVVLRIGNADYASFLTALETATGIQRKDLWEERGKFLQGQMHSRYFTRQERSDNFQIKPARAKVSGWPRHAPESGSLTITDAIEGSRCLALATDSDEYRENCASGVAAGLRRAFDTSAWPLLTLPNLPRPLSPGWTLPATARGE